MRNEAPTRRPTDPSSRRVAAAPAAGVAIALAALVGCGEAAPPPDVTRPVRVVRLGEAAVYEPRRFPGRAEATQEVNLAFRVAGTLNTLPVKVGDAIEAGDVVATLDPRDFEVAVEDAEAVVAQRQADVALAAFELGKVETLFSRDAATELELNQARADRDAAAAAVSSAKSKLDAARDRLSYTTLTAPFAGSITATYVENFEDVNAKEAVARLLDESRIEIVIFVPENLIAQAPNVEAGTVRCEYDAFPGLIIPAEIVEIGTEADQTTRTYPIRAVMDQPEGAKILPGMTGHAWSTRPPIDPGVDPEAFQVPVTAVATRADGGRFVWVVDESTGTVRRRDVEAVIPGSEGVHLKGLEPGSLVVTSGVAFLTEGQRVRVAAAGGDRVETGVEAGS